MEHVLFLWFCEKRNHFIAITDQMLIEQAKELGTSEYFGIPSSFNYSQGWLQKFKQRYHISMQTIHGERGEITEQSIQIERERLLKITVHFRQEDIFKADESATFWKMLPNKTLGPVSGIKVSKERLTIMLISYSNGSEKHKVQVISKTLKPRCFVVNRSSFNPNILVDYFANKKAWQTKETFEMWLKKFNIVIRSTNSRRKVLLLLDNAKSHSDIELSNIMIEYFSPGLTSVIQPNDAGIIRNFKCKYKINLTKFLLKSLNTSSTLIMPNIKEALYLIVNAWKEVTPTTIHNCWKKVGIINDDVKIEFDEADQLSSSVKNLQILLDELKSGYYDFHNEEVLSAEEFIDAYSTLETNEPLTVREIFDKFSDDKYEANSEDLEIDNEEGIAEKKSCL